MKTAVYPGSFDPITLGHLDILKRALEIFDKVIIAVAKNSGKKPLFGIPERVRLIEENIADMPNVEVAVLDGLTIDFAEKNNACALIRGLRVVSDFEFEFQLAQMNRHLNDSIETILLMPSNAYFYTSSTLIKEVANFKPEKIRAFAPENVVKALVEKRKNTL